MHTIASAPGKIILAGEHAVVYGQPAIAVPLWETKANATIHTQASGRGCTIIAHDLNQKICLCDAADDHPLALVMRLTLKQLDLPSDPDWQVEVRSDIPIASGLGSGAAISAALVRAIYHHVGQEPEPRQVNDLVYQSEVLHHGTPSGIDNTVIAYGKPTWFIKGQQPQQFEITQPFTIVIADTGLPSPTKDVVSDVRRAWQINPKKYNDWFEEIGSITSAIRRSIERGEIKRLGLLFDQNQTVLQAMGVSSPALDKLIDAARSTGASGAKLSGGGRGGNMIALIEANRSDKVREALMRMGAKRVIVTEVTASNYC